MNELDHLIFLCYEFKKGKLGIKDFQKKIELIILPDECKYTLEKHQHNASNYLEEIFYCYQESRKKYADKVADQLIQATIEEQERLRKNNLL